MGLTNMAHLILLTKTLFSRNISSKVFIPKYTDDVVHGGSYTLRQNNFIDKEYIFNSIRKSCHSKIMHDIRNNIILIKLKDSEVSNEKNDSYQNYFQLTRQFINNVVSNLDFSTSNCKAYALVPKFQKAIVLHRFLQYLLFFYDGKRQEKTYQIENSTREGSNLSIQKKDIF